MTCERCGYRVEGLPIDARCPECALSVAASLANLREGSPYQRDGSARGLLSTVREALRRPRLLWASVKIDWHSSWQLQSKTLLIAAWLHAFGPAAAIARANSSGGDWIGAAVFASLPLAIPCFLVAFLATEARGGLARLGVASGARLDKARSTTVTAHSSAAWIAGGALATASALAVINLGAGLRPPAWDRVLTATQLGSWLVGASWFVVLSAMGFRALRFANSEPAPPYQVRSAS